MDLLVFATKSFYFYYKRHFLAKGKIGMFYGILIIDVFSIPPP